MLSDKRSEGEADIVGAAGFPVDGRDSLVVPGSEAAARVCRRHRAEVVVVSDREQAAALRFDDIPDGKEGAGDGRPPRQHAGVDLFDASGGGDGKAIMKAEG